MGCPERAPKRRPKLSRPAMLDGMSAAAELTAVSSTLSELTRRVTRILTELSPADEERYGTDLAEVERTLGVANRRLERLISESRSGRNSG
jgi:hypothetical protein